MEPFVFRKQTEDVLFFNGEDIYLVKNGRKKMHVSF